MKSAEIGGTMKVIGKKTIVELDANGELIETVHRSAVLGESDRFGFIARRSGAKKNGPYVSFVNGDVTAIYNDSYKGAKMYVKITADKLEDAVKIWNDLVTGDAE